MEWAGLRFVFTTHNGSSVRVRYFDRELERLAMALGVLRLTGHCLRYTAATHMVRPARDLGELRAVAGLLGHRPEILMRVYT